MSKTMKLLYRVLAVLFLAFYLTCGFWAHFGVSQLWIWLAAAILCLACSFTGFLGERKLLRRAWRVCACVGVAALLALMCVIGAHMNDKLPDGLDCVIVLGARVDANGEPSKALRHRLELAEEYLSANPDTVVIVSGGQGANEPVSEAQCMRDLLVASGISEDRVIMEDAATNTRENFLNSRALLPSEDASVGFITNNFHVTRALLVAREAGFENISAGAASFVGPLKWHYLVRESIGLVAEKLLR